MTEAFTNPNEETHFINNTDYPSETDEDLVSERVHILANSVYQEFESLIRQHGQGTVDGLMPLIVSILETMDKLYTCKDELSLQLDLIKEDQKELYNQYERERTYRRLAEEKNNRLEDQFEEERREFEDRIELVESNNKLMEMRSRNCRDLISRLEEKEIEIRKEYSSLQLRYSELLKSKYDHGNKHRSLNSQCALEEPQSGHQSPVVASQKLKSKKSEKEDIILNVPLEEKSEKDEGDSSLGTQVGLTQLESVNELSLNEEIGSELRSQSNFQYEDKSTNQDLDFFMSEEPFENFTAPNNNSNDDDEDVSSGGEFDDLVMGKEIEFLIKENQDLVETKNALNIVKDDLINKLDEMTGEMCILREDLRSAIKLKKEYKAQAQELEKKIDDISEQLKLKELRLIELGEDENLIECSINENGCQTKTKFTRAEVARILQERNKYKEELLELQETIRYQSSLLDKSGEKSKRGIWKMFSNVLNNATAFTTEAFIGTGNEMTVGQLNRNFSSHNTKSVCYIQDEHGESLRLPNLVNNSPSHKNQLKKLTPGSVVRVTNPLLANLNNDNRSSSSFDFVPIDYNQSSQECDSSL